MRTVSSVGAAGAARTGRRWSAALIVAIALVGGACGDDDEPGAATVAGTVAAGDLDGRSFTSTAVEGHELVAGTVVTLTFDGDLLVATAGCNSMRGPFEVGAELTVGTLAQTMMGCEPDLQRQDEWLSAFLEGGPRLALDGDALTLTDATVTVSLRES